MRRPSRGPSGPLSGESAPLRAVAELRLALFDLAAADTVERGERAARVGLDPDVDHRGLAAAIETGPALAVARSEPGHATLGREAQVVVDVPLRELPADVGDVVERLAGLEHVHRGHQLLPAVAVGLVHERLGVVGVEDVPVGEVVDVHVVLVAGHGIADRAEAVGFGGRRIGVLRQPQQRNSDQVLGACLLFGCDTLDAAEVDRLGRVVRLRRDNRSFVRFLLGRSRGVVVRVPFLVVVAGRGRCRVAVAV